MNLTPAQKIRLGVFLAAGSIMLAGGVLVLAGMKVWEKRDAYTVRFAESVSGLEPSAAVRYQGLRVGRVESMRIAADDPSSIEVALSLEKGTPLYEGTRATLDMSGITGLKTINLEGGDARATVIAPGARLPAGESFIDRVTGKAEEVVVKAEVVANQLARWTNDENRLRVERLLESIDKLVVDLDLTINESRAPLIDTLKAVSEVSQRTARLETEGIKTLSSFRTELEATARSARGALGQVETKARDLDAKEITRTVVSARKAMEKLEARLSEAEAGQAIGDLSIALKETTKLLRELDLVVRAGREDFVVSLSYVRQAAEDLREFSRIIAQDPSVLLRGQEVQE